MDKAADDVRKRASRVAKEGARAAEEAALVASAPAALAKLKTHYSNDLATALGSLFKAEMRALLFAHCGKSETPPCTKFVSFFERSSNEITQMSLRI